MNKIIPYLTSLALATRLFAVEPVELSRLEQDLKNHPNVMERHIILNGVSSDSYLLDVNGLQVQTSDFGFQISYIGDNERGTYYDFNKDGKVDGLTFSTSDEGDKGLCFAVRDMIANEFDEIRLKLSFSTMEKELKNKIKFASAFQPDGDIYTADFGEGVLLKSKNDSLKIIAQGQYDNNVGFIRKFLDNSKKDSIYKIK